MQAQLVSITGLKTGRTMYSFDQPMAICYHGNVSKNFKSKPRRAARLQLADMMQDLEMNQQQLAKALKCSRSFVTHVLLGTKMPGLQLAVSIEEFSGGKIRCKDWL